MQSHELFSNSQVNYGPLDCMSCIMYENSNGLSPPLISYILKRKNSHFFIGTKKGGLRPNVFIYQQHPSLKVRNTSVEFLSLTVY